MDSPTGQTYQIKTPQFEGPLPLLLNLIQERKLHISDFSLAQVTEDYLKYVKNLGETRHEEVSSFIVVASTLILIKSKSLLPNLELTPEEKGDIKSLEERLRLYELFTRLSGNIKENFGEKIIFPPNERKNTMLVFLPDSQITPNSMMALVTAVLRTLPQAEKLPEVPVKKVISIEEMIEHVVGRITVALKSSFNAMFNKKEKMEAIVGFLAMLELVRQGILDAVQNEDDIIIVPTPGGVGIPTASVGKKL